LIVPLLPRYYFNDCDITYKTGSRHHVGIQRRS
jgi:hypothetical protein